MALKQQKENAKKIIDQAQKNIQSIANDIIALEQYQKNTPIPSCSLKRLDSIHKSCANNDSLYSTIAKDEDFNLLRLKKKFQNELISYKKPYNENIKGVFKRSELSPKATCSMSDALAKEIFFYAQSSSLTKILHAIKPIKENKDIKIQLEESLYSGEVVDFSLLESFSRTSYHPLFAKILTTKDYNDKLNPLENLGSVLTSEKLRDSVKEDIKQKCNDTFRKLKTSLCHIKKEQALTDYKNLRENLRKVDDKYKIAQNMHLYCQTAKNSVAISIKETKDDLNNVLPQFQKNQTKDEFSKKSYKTINHNTRLKVCDFIPPNNNDVLGEIDKCKTDQAEGEHCDYLFAYEQVVLKSFKQEHKLADFKALKHEDGSPYSESQAKEAYEKKKKEFFTNFNGQKQFKKPTKLMANFLDLKQDKKDSKANVDQKISSTDQKVQKTKKVGQSSTTSRSSGQNKSFNNRSPSSVNNNPTTNKNKHSTNAFNNTFHNENDFGASSFESNNNSMDDIYSEMAKRVLKQKPKEKSTQPGASSKRKKLTRKEKKKRKEKLREFKEKYSNNSTSSYEPEYDENDNQSIQEFLTDQKTIDQGLKSSFSGNRRAPSSFSSALAPYTMRKFNGDIQKLPGLEVGSIANTGATGVAAEEIPEVVLYGSLAEDLKNIDPKKVVTYDPNKGNIEYLANLVKQKESFVISNNGDDQQRVLAKVDEFGEYQLLIINPHTGRYTPKDELQIKDQEFEKFYNNLEVAFQSKFYTRLYSLADSL